MIRILFSKSDKTQEVSTLLCNGLKLWWLLKITPKHVRKIYGPLIFGLVALIESSDIGRFLDNFAGYSLSQREIESRGVAVKMSWQIGLINEVYGELMSSNN